MKNLKELSLRINNIRSIQKTTKIMHMVSAVKLLQSQKRLLNSRLYISELYGIIFSLISTIDQGALVKILNTGEDDLCLVFIIVSDRGLCGNFNSSIMKFSKRHVNRLATDGKKVDIVFYGKKAFDMERDEFLSKRILKIENSNGVMLERIESLIDDINIDKYSRIEIVYNKFCNTFIRKPTLELVKPWNKDSSLICSSLVNLVINSYEYEPQNIKFILRFLINNYVIASIYSALHESITSENGARMIVMELANKNSGEILDKLTLLYNCSRQARITTDLIEIVSAAESL
ncbi:MAG: F0F1 ATP synthase subunit gamma [Wolbachia endosymbiont of Menacanthus eurysternus]|nr:MAG: F0F1 ATP synthase subunit gamma [Wolbachia endosymbiont of Menacanthus eurysternus]